MESDPRSKSIWGGVSVHFTIAASTMDPAALGTLDQVMSLCAESRHEERLDARAQKRSFLYISDIDMLLLPNLLVATTYVVSVAL